MDSGCRSGSGRDKISDMEKIKRLAKAIKDLHGCEAQHVESVPVKELFRGEVAWEGVVEVFAISGHPRATFCYAWSHLEGDKDERTRFFAVLGMPPVNSPLDAVHAAIASQSTTEKG